MIFSLILGVIVGVISVLFILQNTTIITVSFLSWNMTGSLALILLLTIASGVVMTLLILLPSLIRDELYVSAIKKHAREAEDELAKTKHALAEAQSRATQQIPS